MGTDDDGFLSRWSRRKVQARREPVPEATPSAPAPAAAVAPVVAPAVADARPSEAALPPPPPPPPPTLDDARALTPASDFSRYVRADVAPEVRHTALKTLFSDPHFNVMDGLDTYIDDYGRPDPLPESMRRQMTQAAFLNLFADEPAPPDTASPAPEPAPDEDPDLRLQPHDAAGPAGPGPGAGEDAGREP